MSGQPFNQYPMMQQNPLFYQNPNQPNPINLNQSGQNFQSFNNAFTPMPQIPFNGYDPKSQFKNNNFVNPGTLLQVVIVPVTPVEPLPNVTAPAFTVVPLSQFELLTI